MINDIRIYNYDDNEPLITRMTQIKQYLDGKFAHIDVDVDLSGVKKDIRDSKNEIIEKIETSKPSTENLATKEDIAKSEEAIVSEVKEVEKGICKAECHVVNEIKKTQEQVCCAKCQIVNKIVESKNEIIKEIDEKFVNLNEIIK